MQTIQIQEITSVDAERYKKFFASGLVQDEEFFRMTPEDDLYSPFPTKGTSDSFTLGAFVDHALAGVVSFMREGENRQKLRHKGLLFRMYVSRQFRGRGIARMLLQELLVRASQVDGIEQINLTVISHNTGAKQLYEKFGFRTFSSEKKAVKWKGQYFDEDQMSLHLI